MRKHVISPRSYPATPCLQVRRSRRDRMGGREQWTLTSSASDMSVQEPLSP
jgi:hypothetical protein